MTNLVLFLVTTVVYWAVSLLVTRPREPKNYLTRFLLIMLLCLPININDNIITILGNAASEKSIFSVASLYQKANKNAFCIYASYQNAGQDAHVGIGIAGYQNAGGNATVDIGIAGYQNAGGNATVDMGIAGYQNAGRNAIVGMGIAGYQNAGQDAAVAIGIAGYQQVGEKTRSFAIFSRLKNE